MTNMSDEFFIPRADTLKVKELEAEIESLRAQLASAQAEKAELVKRCADKCTPYFDAEYFEMARDIHSDILTLLPKDHQEVNKCD
jgi:predicted transcriptional regulator